MHWIGEYIVEADGLCHWRERFRFDDPDLAAACRDNPLTRLFVESWMQMGVKVGIA